MAKCSKCSKEIKNTYMLNGKVYGYNCYKQELAMILAEKEKQAKEKYKTNIAATVEILKNRSKLNDFLKGIVNFYEEKGFLSHKQMKCIKLNHQEELEKWLIIYTMSNNTREKEEVENIIVDKLYRNTAERDINIKDERLINLLKSHKKITRRILQGKNVSLYKYITDKKIITTLEMNSIKDIKEGLKECEIKFIEGVEF